MPAPSLTINDLDAIDQVDPERTVQELLYLWLAHLFDGDTHDIGEDAASQSLAFPDCQFHFNADRLSKDPQPLIHIVFSDRRADKADWTDATTKRVWEAMTLLIAVRVGHKGRGQQRADKDCRRVADLVKLVFEETLRDSLAHKGIDRHEWLRGPFTNPAGGFAVRQSIVRLHFSYEMIKVPR